MAEDMLAQILADLGLAPGQKTQPVPFDPHGAGYDYATARLAGLAPQSVPTDSVPHWPTRDPSTGMVLKGRMHPTWDLGRQADEALGYRLEFRDGRYYSVKK